METESVGEEGETEGETEGGRSRGGRYFACSQEDTVLLLQVRSFP